MTQSNDNSTFHSDEAFAMVNTLREFRRVSIYGWAALAIPGLFVGSLWSWVAAAQWLLQAGLLWILVLYESRRNLPLNRNGPESPPYSRLGPANRLTILRGWLIAGTGGFLFQPSSPGTLALVPAVFYTISAIIDRIDGYAARRTGQVSQMGIELDTVFDALGLAVAPLLAVWYGKIHWSYLLVSCAYYLFKWGIRYRQMNGLVVFALKPRLTRRAIAGFQMGFIAVVLFPVFQPPVTLIAGFAFMLPVLTGFMIDWLVVSGRISDETFINHRLLGRVEKLISYCIQPLLRLVLAGAMITILVRYMYDMSTPALVISYCMYGMAACGMLILLGIMGRLAALVLVLLLGWYYSRYMPGPPDYILLSATIWILVLGTGHFSMYTWDDDWVNRYDGEK